MKEFIDNDIPKPPTIDAQDMVEWNKCAARERRITMEGVRDNIAANLHGKDTPYEIWKALIELFQKNSDQRKLELKDKLQKIKTEKGDIITQ